MEAVTKSFDYDNAFFIGFSDNGKTSGVIFSRLDTVDEIRELLDKLTKRLAKSEQVVLASQKAKDFHYGLRDSINE